MSKRFWWLFPLVAGGGFFLWFAMVGIRPKKNEIDAVSHPEASANLSAASISDSASESLDHETARESPRHSTGEIERHQAEETSLAHLEKAVSAQEKKVEERRKVLATIVRTKGIIYKGSEADHSGSVETREESFKKSLDAQDYVDAKRDFETDQQLLQKLKLKLIAAQIGNKDVGK